uniref:Uncharacterized protein n=1 Tax=Glossina austeni TaxID=7395 RepID=A0A1A9VLN8_GLOAU
MKNCLINIHILILIFAIQNIFSSPVQDADSSTFAINQQLNEHNKLFELTLNQFVQFTLDFGEQCKNFSSKLFKELEADGKIEDKEFSEEAYNKFVQSFENLKNAKSTEDKLTYLNKITLETITSAKNLEEDKILAEFLQKYEPKEFLEKVYALFSEYFKGFTADFNDYANALNEKQKQEQQQLLDWFKEFSKEQSFAEKTQKFLDFFALFDCCHEK